MQSIDYVLLLCFIESDYPQVIMFIQLHGVCRGHKRYVLYMYMGYAIDGRNLRTLSIQFSLINIVLY